MKRAVRTRWILGLAILYLIGLAVIWALIHFDTGSRWPVTLFLFSPRWAIAVPLLVLVPLTLATRFQLTFIYLLHGMIIAFPILGYRVSLTRQADSNERQVLRVLTCNLGGGAIRTDQLAALAIHHQSHVLMLQECPSSVSKPVFQQLGWAYRQDAHIAIGSSFELGDVKTLARQTPTQYNAVVDISCEIRIPSALAASKDEDPCPDASKVHLVGLHLPTFRPALAKALRLELDSGTAINSVASQYGDMVEQVLQKVRELDAPTVIAGDFNVPVESAHFRNYWSDYQNAFSKVGTGLGYTKYTRFHGIRIDHVLADNNWTIDSAMVGAGLGGDHRPVLVELTLNR